MVSVSPGLASCFGTPRNCGGVELEGLPSSLSRGMTSGCQGILCGNDLTLYGQISGINNMIATKYSCQTYDDWSALHSTSFAIGPGASLVWNVCRLSHLDPTLSLIARGYLSM